MPAAIGKLATDLLRDPAKVAVAPAATTIERVTQRVIHVENHNKRALLVELLADARMSRTLVFTRTKRGADRVARHLEAAGLCVAAIHGNKSQRQREAALNAFRRSDIRVLVATDIAARGIDIDQVTHVVNYELPDVPESYVHRIGRTARAGAAGIAISLCDVEERGRLREIERVTRQAIPAEDRRGDQQLATERPSRPLTRRYGRGETASALRERPAKRAGQPHCGRTRPAPASASGRSDLAGVAFLAAPSRRTPSGGSHAQPRDGRRHVAAARSSDGRPSFARFDARREGRD
jgi:ATP-dependent RNA helicase RhlE